MCSESSLSCIAELLEDVASAEGDRIIQTVHRTESRADDLRREIEYALYQRALIPESRGDVLGILENFDHIPGMFQSLSYQLRLEVLQIPAEYRAAFKELVEVTLEAYRLVSEAVLGHFYNQDIKDLAESVKDRLILAAVKRRV